MIVLLVLCLQKIEKFFEKFKNLFIVNINFDEQRRIKKIYLNKKFMTNENNLNKKLTVKYFIQFENF